MGEGQDDIQLILVPRNFLRQELDGPQKFERMDVRHKSTPLVGWIPLEKVQEGIRRVGSRHPTLSAIFFSFFRSPLLSPTMLPGLSVPEDRRVRVNHSETAAHCDKEASRE